MLNDLIEVLNHKFLDLPLYKIALAFFVFTLFILLRKLFTDVILKYLHTYVAKTETDIDDKLLEIMKEPLRFVFIIFAIYFSSYMLEIHSIVVYHLIISLVIFTLFWVIYSSIKIIEPQIIKFTQKFHSELSLEISSFIIKAIKVFVIFIGISAMLKQWGIDISTLIASLGLGGLAFALAAKDTASNLFGGLAILTDKIFKIGDWVKVGKVEGIVEDIGMRTTKIRAFDKRLITVPNSMIANSAVDNFSRRDRRRIKMRVGVTYSTSPKQMQIMLSEIREMLFNHTQIHNDPLFVYFDEFQDSSLSIFFYLFTTTAVWEEYLKIREDINLKIIEIIERNGASIAFPSQSIYFENSLKTEKN